MVLECSPVPQLTPVLLTFLPCAICALFLCPPLLIPVKLLSGAQPEAPCGDSPGLELHQKPGKWYLRVHLNPLCAGCEAGPAALLHGEFVQRSSAKRGRVLFPRYIFFFLNMSFHFPRAFQIRWEGGTSRGHTTNISPAPRASPHSLPGYHPRIIPRPLPSPPGARGGHGKDRGSLTP